METGHQDIHNAIEANYNANVMSHREMKAAIAELERQVAELLAIVQPTPAEVRLSRYQQLRHAQQATE